MDSPAEVEPIIEQLVFRIRAYKRTHGAPQSFGWLYARGFGEGASFAFGAGAAADDPQGLLAYQNGGEVWDYADAYETGEADGEPPGSSEPAGVYAWYLAEGRLNGRGSVTLQYRDWQMVSDGRLWQAVGFMPEGTAATAFSLRFYRAVLAETVRRYPGEIQGFVLGSDDWEHPQREWVDGRTEAV